MAKSVVEVYPGLKGIAEMINAMASAPFTFLPILLGFQQRSASVATPIWVLRWA